MECQYVVEGMLAWSVSTLLRECWHGVSVYTLLREARGSLGRPQSTVLAYSDFHSHQIEPSVAGIPGMRVYLST